MADNNERLQAYGQWLLNNADKKGTPEFSKVSEGYAALRNSPDGIIAGAPEQPKDTSLAGQAVHGFNELNASVLRNTRDTIRSPNSMMQTFDKASDWVTTNVENPVREFVGADPRPLQQATRDASLAKLEPQIAAAEQTAATDNTAPQVPEMPGLGNLKDLPRWGAEKLAQSAAQIGLSVSPGTAIQMAQSQVNDSLRDVKDLSEADRTTLAGFAGVPIAALDRFALTKWLKGYTPAALKALKVPTWLKAFAVPATEAATEEAQELIALGTEAAVGKEFKDGEIATRLTEAPVAGAIGAGYVHGAAKGVGASARLAQATASIPGQLKATKDYSNDPRQVESDLRVNDMYEATKADLAAAKNGTSPAPAPIFAGVKDRLKRQLQSSLTTLYKSGQIEADAFASLVKDHDSLYNSASKHNRDVAQSAYDRISQLELDPAVAEGLTRAFRDLNTVTEASFAKNSNGPLERAAKLLAPVIGGSVGATAGNMVVPGLGMAAGAIAGQAANGLLRKGARSLDAALGTQTPEVIRRAPSRMALLDKAGVDYGSTPKFLGDLEANAKAGAQLTSDAKAKKLRDAAAVGKQNRLKDIVPLGGYHNLIYKQTGLRPTAVDQGLLMLTKDGTIDADELKAALASPQLLMSGNKGNHIIDALQQLKVDGKIAGDAKWQDPLNNPTGPTEIVVYSGSVNPPAHAQTMRNVRQATDNAMRSAPTPALAAVVTQVADARTKADKRLALAQALQANPMHAKWLNEVVGPLTKFGPKE